MNPKPFASLNHFTVPFAMMLLLSGDECFAGTVMVAGRGGVGRNIFADTQTLLDVWRSTFGGWRGWYTRAMLCTLLLLSEVLVYDACFHLPKSSISSSYVVRPGGLQFVPGGGEDPRQPERQYRDVRRHHAVLEQENVRADVQGDRYGEVYGDGFDLERGAVHPGGCEDRQPRGLLAEHLAGGLPGRGGVTEGEGAGVCSAGGAAEYGSAGTGGCACASGHGVGWAECRCTES